MYGTFTYPQGLLPVYVCVCVSCTRGKNDYQKVLYTDDVFATRKKTAIKINYTRLPWIPGSSRNHMICYYPTTSQETFNDGYNNH